MTSVFATIRRGFKWLVSHWHIPLLALAVFVGWFLGRQRQPSKAVADELAAIRDAERVDLDAADRGARLANARVDQDYRRTLAQLDEKQRRKADDLRRNPGKRLRYLRKMAKRARF